ncbi:hypothetical protein KOW79_011812 [Hemibagrus wyckioides]|uniref:VWFA domain-containing protein n=1 Tax=Hemibagrus wyckioides TaxID=337641 RepID=A0A9D3NKY6_9TELE|nr:integrin alpha-X-like [Hemibagrus wyckioides]KAG7325496.1 hypothetical protein KOW79_011812 [Hemibagrus wyckioides]
MTALTMDWTFALYIFLISVSQLVLAFNIDTNPWKNFTQPQSIAFGYKVIQKDSMSVIVSDPLIQSQNQRGRLYSCTVSSESCSPIRINVPSEAINMSLGLSVTKDPTTSNLAVCGPTIPKQCKQFTAYYGMCFILNSNNKPSEPIPRTLRDCPKTDIAFLLDGSGSVNWHDFITMKNFVISMINEFKDRDFQFAVAQYSDICEIHIKFNTFSSTDQISIIKQFRSWTFTATAIKKVVDELFTPQAGARDSANRVLVVITDGQSNDRQKLPSAADEADRKKIIRYAIGVGRAFNIKEAEDELKTIASDPDDTHVFKVDDFSVLKKIQKTLEENIIAIEGTQATGDATRMEFAQDGFSADFVSNDAMIMSAVGAFQWKGGYQKYNTQGIAQNSFHKGNSNESYLGYSMAVAKTVNNQFIIQGAPRDNHMGAVIISDNTDSVIQTLFPPERQIGSYYGAELCVVDLNSDKSADLLLVSAPLHNEGDQEGKVFIYTFPELYGSQVQHLRSVKGIPGQRGRFGLTLASPADLNGDSLVDVVVGAPLEENNQGSIYIFNGRNGDIAPTFSQRITGSSVSSGLQFFGISLSQSALDHSNDQLPDLAVGSKGAVLLLRSRPIVDLQTTVSFLPSKIPIKDSDCSSPLQNIITLCFTMTTKTGITGLSAKLNYSLKLDAKRQSYRAFFSEKNRLLSNTIDVSLNVKCIKHEFNIEACPNDALNPIINELVYTFEGLPSNQLNNLRPMLPPNTRNTTDYNLGFEIKCGDDNICTDNLRVDFNFSGHSVIQVGIMQEMNVTVFIENRGENSYNTRVILKYPFGLSFRRSTTKEGRVECVSVDSDERSKLGDTICYISKPIFKSNGLATFDVTYSINKDSNFDRMVMFTANASSDNDEHSPAQELFRQKSIDVKYAIYVAMIRHENSTIHINFTAGKNDLQKPVHQIFKVENDLRDLSVDIFIRVPIKLGVKDIWTSNSMQIEDCVVEIPNEQPKIPDFVAALKKQPEVNCSVAVCRVFKCVARLSKKQTKYYNISGNVSAGWIEQTGLRSALFELVSTATLDYNKTTYIYYSSDSVNVAPVGKINTQVELYEEKFPLKETIGGVVGGIVILALITAVLYKAGFFKSNYKKMLEEAGAGAEADGAGDNLGAE